MKFEVNLNSKKYHRQNWDKMMVTIHPLKIFTAEGAENTENTRLKIKPLHPPGVSF